MKKNISKVSLNGFGLDVEWNDGEKSNFNFMWLRDNCPTAHDKDSRHRMFNILKNHSYLRLFTVTKRLSFVEFHVVIAEFKLIKGGKFHEIS